MSDLDPNRPVSSSTDPQTRDLRAALNSGDERARAKRDTRNIPPLAWLVLVILIAIAGIAWWQYGGSMHTPTGGDAPLEARDTVAEGSAQAPAPNAASTSQQTTAPASQ